MENPTTINGYEIVEKLNQGSFCDVFRVRKEGKDYFLKRFKEPTYLSSDYEDFKKNQETLAPIINSFGDMSETIVEQFDIDGFYYQVKEFIDGQTLFQWMEENDEYAPRLDIAIQLCECVKAMHEKDIIMQDLKPLDIMLVPDPSKKAGVRVVLVDFDWAVPHGKVIRYVGTSSYENIDGENLSFKSDIFSLGIILSEILTGCNPYFYENYEEGENVQPETLDLSKTEKIDTAILENTDKFPKRVYNHETWVKMVREKDYTAPIIINEDLPQTINDIIEQCLDPDPDKRPVSDDILAVLTKNEE